MLKKIEGRYYRSSQMAAFVKEAERMIEAYGWQKRTVSPYSFSMPLAKVIKDLKDYDICTDGSKEYLISLANGLTDIMNAWEKHAKEPKVEVIVIDSGKRVALDEAFAKELVEEGLCRLA